MEIIGLVLAGGKSSRMGKDKALLDWKGQTMLSRSLSLLQGLCSEVVICSSDPRHAVPGIRRIPDHWPEAGPMGGIASAMEALPSAEIFLVVGVDQVGLTTGVLQFLRNQFELGYSNENLALAYSVEERLQPLGAIYHRGLLPLFRRNLALEKRSLFRLFEQLPQLENIPFESSFKDSPTVYSNINTPGDLQIMNEDIQITPEIKVLFFGYLTERCGVSEVSISAKDIDILKQQLESEYAALKGLNYLLAVNQAQIHGNEELNEGDEVALMPPFAGG